MDRRNVLLAAGASAAAVLTGRGALTAADSPPGDLRIAAREAWLWGMPLVEMAQQRSARADEGVRANTFQHQRALITAKGQFVTAPNNDTLYSQAWLDLENGPVTIGVPASGGRYWCVPFMDMYSNNFAMVGTRTAGAEPITVTVVGPRQATDDPRAIRAPTNSVWILGRTLVVDEADLPQVHAFQDAWTIRGPDAATPRSYAKRTAPWSEYFAAVQALMNDNPPPPSDEAILRRMAPLLRLGGAFDASRFSPAEVAAIEAGIADAPGAMTQARSSAVIRNGWQFPLFGLGSFENDYAYRAAVAIGGLGALPRREAVYFRGAGQDLRGYDSGTAWRLRFDAGQLPPVHSFWSLSMYRLTQAGQLFFVDNPINRYAIGDRTPGLRTGADGSLTIHLSRADPGDPGLNWLPSPSSGNFVLSLRAYVPKTPLVEGSYLPPALVPV